MLQRPEQDRRLLTRGELEARIKVALGGTVAEELALGEISSGATSDLSIANRLAGQMVREYGMSRLGRTYLSGTSYEFVGGSAADVPSHSEQTAREVDLEVRDIVQSCLQQVRTILENGLPALRAVTDRLAAKEVLDDSELVEILEQVGFPIVASARRNLLKPALIEV